MPSKTPTPAKTNSFTLSYHGKSNVLKTEISISQAFNPQKTKKTPKFGKYSAIWDTGATNCVISKKVIDECGLKPTGMTQVHSVGLTTMRGTYLVNIILPNKVGLHSVKATEGEIVGTDVLIGMDVIGLGDFAVTNKDRKTTMSFRLPSVEKIDFVEQTKKTTPISAIKVGRNDPCPCNSGKKYKKCHGR